MFSKKKLKIKNKKNNLISIIGLIGIFFVFLLALGAISFAKNINFLSDKSLEKNIIQQKTNLKEGKKDSNKINILIVGRGGTRNDAPNLTDTIILASINKKFKTISLFSIPRDLYVEYKNGKKGKINKIYALQRHKTGSVKAGMDALKYNVELLTGEKIDYYINVDFNGFVKFVDALGGITITVPKKLVDTKFPDNNWGYTTFVIRKGTWLFDGETALKYARSRHSTSDFDRSLRQQQIIKAIRNKLLKGGFFEKISKVKKVYDIFKQYVLTDIGLSDAISIFNEIKDNNYKIISSNLNDSCFDGDPLCSKGGFLYTPEREIFAGASVLLVRNSHIGDLNNYKILKKYLQLVFDNPLIYKENIEISVYNSTKTSLLASNLSFKLRQYGFNIPYKKGVIGTIRKIHFKKSFINYTKDIKNSETIKYLKNLFPHIVFKEVENLEYTKDPDAKIEIIIGQDYKNIFNDLKNNLN